MFILGLFAGAFLGITAMAILSYNSYNKGYKDGLRSNEKTK